MYARQSAIVLCGIMLCLGVSGCIDTGAPKRKERARDDTPPPATNPDAAKKTPPPPSTKTPPATAAKTDPKTAAPAAGKAAPAADAAKAPAEATAEAAPEAKEPAEPVVELPDVPSASSISVDAVPANNEWSPQKKMEQTELRMKKIVLAMIEYAKQNGRMLPDATTIPPNQSPLLSWCVSLLPFLGHDELYQKFKLKEGWQSNNNKKLLKEMPPVYQNPWNATLTDSTVFVVPRSAKSLFGGDPLGRELTLVTDDWKQTVALLMLDDARAVPWIQPADYKLRAGCSTGVLGKPLGGFLATMADGDTKWFPLSGSREKYPGFFTIDGQEKVTTGSLLRPLGEAQDAFVAYSKRDIEVVPDDDIKGLLAEFRSIGPGGGMSSVSPSSSDGSGSEPAEDTRAPVPDKEQIASANAKLRKAFSEPFKEVKSYPDKRLVSSQYAHILLDQLENVQSDPVDAYVLLDLARTHAMAAGDFRQSMKATDEITSRYKVDTFQYQIDVLKAANDHLLIREQNEEIKEKAKEMLKVALAKDAFAAADTLFEVYADSVRSRSSGNSKAPAGKGGVNELAAIPIIQKEINNRQATFKAVPEALEVLKQYEASLKGVPPEELPKDLPPEIKEANSTIGKYYALVKMDWAQGSPYLQKGNNLKLKLLAAVDSGMGDDPKAMAELADEYMALADVEVGSIFKRGLKFRAVFWYEQCLDNLPPSLHKVQAGKNVEAVKKDKEYKEIIEQALEIMETKKKK